MAIHQQIQFVLRTTLIYINVGSHILPSHSFASIRVVGTITKCKLLHFHDIYGKLQRGEPHLSSRHFDDFAVKI